MLTSQFDCNLIPLRVEIVGLHGIVECCISKLLILQFSSLTNLYLKTPKVSKMKLVSMCLRRAMSDDVDMHCGCQFHHSRAAFSDEKLTIRS